MILPDFRKISESFRTETTGISLYTIMINTKKAHFFARG